jgi:hypothetical protein
MSVLMTTRNLALLTDRHSGLPRNSAGRSTTVLILAASFCPLLNGTPCDVGTGEATREHRTWRLVAGNFDAILIDAILMPRAVHYLNGLAADDGPAGVVNRLSRGVHPAAHPPRLSTAAAHPAREPRGAFWSLAEAQSSMCVGGAAKSRPQGCWSGPIKSQRLSGTR